MANPTLYTRVDNASVLYLWAHRPILPTDIINSIGETNYENLPEHRRFRFRNRLRCRQ